MGRAKASVEVEASLAETWDLFFEPRAWPGWVDGFRSVEASQGYPERDGTLRWRSTPAGRGTVTERVLEHEPRRRHRVSFSDEQSYGELETRFEITADDKVTVTQEIEYRPRQHGAFGPLTDRLFIRRQVRASMARSLNRFRHEVEELVSLGGTQAV
jgi:uncharacterized membrane protein